MSSSAKFQKPAFQVYHTVAPGERLSLFSRAFQYVYEKCSLNICKKLNGLMSLP